MYKQQHEREGMWQSKTKRLSDRLMKCLLLSVAVARASHSEAPPAVSGVTALYQCHREQS